MIYHYAYIGLKVCEIGEFMALDYSTVSVGRKRLRKYLIILVCRIQLKKLKEKTEITKTTIECPVKDCNVKVERQRKVFVKEDRFKCPKHKIFISPSTFEYFDEADNFL